MLTNEMEHINFALKSLLVMQPIKLWNVYDEFIMNEKLKRNTGICIQTERHQYKCTIPDHPTLDLSLIHI